MEVGSSPPGYIGYTEKVDGERFDQHFSGEGSKWTQLYKPIQVMEWREGTLEDEKAVTLEYMTKYGWWNVRGGPWCNVNMTKPPTCLIPQLPEQINYELPEQINLTIPELPKPIINDCSRCGRKGHCQEECYAKKDIRGKCINDCLRCGRDHPTEKCYATKDIRGDYITW